MAKRNRFDVDEELQAPFSMANLKTVLVYLARVKGKMLAALGIQAVGSIIGLTGPLFVQRALDVAIPAKDVGQLVLLCAILAGTILINVGCVAVRGVLVAKASQTIIYDIRKDLFGHLQDLPFTYYDSRPHGKILVRVTSYVNNVSDALSSGILNFIIEIINIVIIIVFMFQVNATLALVTVAGLPLMGIFMFLIKPKQRRAWQDVSNKNSNLNAYVQESIEGVRVTQAFTRQEANLQTLDDLASLRAKSWMRAVYVSNSVWYAAETISQLVFTAVYMVGAWVLQPMATFGVLLTMGSYANRFWQPIINLANIYNTFINAIAYLERVFETIKEPAVVEDAPDATEMPTITGEVRFEDVSFSYDGAGGKKILKNVSFTAKPGESIAIVGPTGAGKTTIVNLISRFYNIEEGVVRIDGQDIMGVTLHSLRSQMGIMLQDNFLFSGTVADNIRYGKLNATDEEVQNAARLLHAHTFVEKLPEGYETVVKERGGGLSQGEKQLLAFARTLLSNPRILVLDEATSSIDTGTELLVQQGIELLMQGRTSFIIAHRLSTIRDCSRIMYVADGQIQESGTHDELMAAKGDYYKLYQSQFH